jgi:MoaA/NifB/PqqE/SkfB family radical SAM enzyme
MLMPDNESIPHIGLRVEITDNCNLECFWCCNKKEYRKIGAWTRDVALKFCEHLAHFQYHYIAFLGGEPLLYPDMLVNIIQVVKNFNPETEIWIMTNGTRLTQELVSFFNDFNAHVCVSIQGSEYKSLKTLVQHAKDGIIELINTLKIFSIRSVILRGRQDMAADAILLHSVFPRAVIEMSLDKMSLGELDVVDIVRLRREMNALNRRYSDLADWFHWFRLEGLFTAVCDCRANTRTFTTDGVVGWKESFSTRTGNGCVLYEDEMKPGLYDLYRKVLSDGDGV